MKCISRNCKLCGSWGKNYICSDLKYKQQRKNASWKLFLKKLCFVLELYKEVKVDTIVETNKNIKHCLCVI